MGIPPFHAKEEQHDGGAYDQPPLKITKDSNFLTRLPPPPTPPPSSSTTSSTTTTSDGLPNKPQPQQQQQPRRPVIIYTHSPKVIHTHPRDFMALVQKLTGYTPPPEETHTQQTQDRRHHHRGQGNNTEDNESTSVVTEEHGSSVNDVPHVNSCFVDGGVGVGVGPPPYRAGGFDPYFNPTPVFSANPTDLNYFCGSTHQLPYYNPDSLFLNRNSSSSLRVLKEYPDI